ncbi:hypothetical protein AB1L30_12590 [Bremerella sp. JC817]|uniref:hypothetical protein n=1 Tax=Bremerella sp. JC817 TaxID=3231756 RepID=UPI00345A7B94
MNWYKLLGHPYVIAAIVLATIPNSSLLAADDAPGSVSVKPVGVQSHFAETTAPLRFQFHATKAFAGRVLWQYAIGSRTVTRIEEALELNAGETSTIELTVSLPQVRNRTILESEITAVIVDAAGNELTSSKQAVYLFPKDPYVARREWLKSLDIQLFDPEGKTAKRFESDEIPFNRITNANTLDNLESGILIVGHGVSLKKQRALVGSMLTLAARGVQIVVLAPSDGTLDYPTPQDVTRLSKITFQNRQVISQLDKRFDPEFDRVDANENQPGGLELTSVRGALKLEVVEDASDWCWWQASFESGGSCTICCIDLETTWESAPTARFLFASILEELSPEHLPNSSE